MSFRVVFVTGGVLSSLGKGVAAGSLGALLEARGYKIRIKKFEPYLNIDPGTMSPFQHGEVFVTEDGAETDLDLGHYERFTNVYTRKTDAVSTGQIYSNVLAKERKGEYLGATVQVIPHITNEIKQRIIADVDQDTDFLICEIGGTVGDIESLPFIETIRQFANDFGRSNVLFLHLTLVPFIKCAKEIKTKPTQHSVKELQSMGIQPDILLCRSEVPIPEDARTKLSLFCNIPFARVIEALDVSSIYEVPISYAEKGLDTQVCQYFSLPTTKPNLKQWHDIVHKVKNPKDKIEIAVIGKYTELKDAYKSLEEALSHAGIANQLHVHINWINAETLEQFNEVPNILRGMGGILIPGGYGERGIKGKMYAIQYARENNIPFLGICLGMQLAVIEFARNVLEMRNANSTEFDNKAEPVVHLMTKWVKNGVDETRNDAQDIGGTMRLGGYDCILGKGTLAHNVYKADNIIERHRHRYEVNKKYITDFENKGMIFSGFSPDGLLPEMIEIKDHKWFLAMQFHPEFKSKPTKPHPVFASFVSAAYSNIK